MSAIHSVVNRDEANRQTNRNTGSVANLGDQSAEGQVLLQSDASEDGLHLGYAGPDALRRNDVHESRAEQDQANRQRHPGQVLERRVLRQVLIKPYPGWWNKDTVLTTRSSRRIDLLSINDAENWVEAFGKN